MLLKNWYNHLYARIGYNSQITVNDMLGNSRSASVNGNATGDLSFGGVEATSCYSPSMRYLRTALKADLGGAIIGTGTTAPTFDDYALSGELISTFSATVSFSSAADNDGVTNTAVYTITNTGSTAFTIGEIGLFVNATNAATSTTGGKYCVLVERSLLEVPVTIPAGGVGQVTYAIRMPYPTV